MGLTENIYKSNVCYFKNYCLILYTFMYLDYILSQFIRAVTTAMNSNQNLVSANPQNGSHQNTKQNCRKSSQTNIPTY